MKTCFTLKKTYWLWMFCLLLAACQEDNDEPQKELLLEHEEVNLNPGQSLDVLITSGNGAYEVHSSNEEILTAGIGDNTIKLTAFDFKEYAEVIVYVSDGRSNRTQLLVRIANFNGIDLSEDHVVLPRMQAADTVHMQGVGKYYTIEVSDPEVVEVSDMGGDLVFQGKQLGEAVVTVQDRYAGKAEIKVEVQGEKMMLDFSDRIFGYARFDEIAVVDKSIQRSEQVTFEMTCKVQGYRGLQTFMGLEGQLIIRGKNDDYKEDHPIQIAGLGDRIMLESTSSFDLGEWMNIALVVDCSKTAVEEKYKLYINGVEDPLIIRREEETHQWIDLASSNDGNRFVVGRAFGQDWRAIRGMVSEARVWTVARTAEQISANMCVLEENEAEGLLAHWNFSAGVATDYIQDISGGKYETNLILADARENGAYYPMIVPENLFLPDNCQL